MSFELGLERLLKDKQLRKPLEGKRIALVAHPASVDQKLNHSLDLLRQAGLNITCAFGPQHGMRGEKQDNMIESDDYQDPIHKIPVFSLYGKVRRPTKDMMSHFDVVVVDLQDVGCRIYTFLTTLFYLMEDCAAAGKSVWVLDRPNPAGRPVEGNLLDMKFASFVGAAPVPMRHGMTLGEAGLWFKKFAGLNVDYHVVEMAGYSMARAPGFGWPDHFAWVNPSPNMPGLATARAYAGTVLIEGTYLSEARGTTKPLEMFGGANLDIKRIYDRMMKLEAAWFDGCVVRPCYFEPTFHKFKGELCAGFQIHTDGPFYNHEKFKPYRLICSFFKAVHEVHPDFTIFKNPPYEYETVNMPIDILSGDSFLRHWVEDSSASARDLDKHLLAGEKSFAPVHIYK